MAKVPQPPLYPSEIALAENIDQVRKLLKLHKIELAEDAGITDSHLNEIIKKKKRASSNVICAIAARLKVSVDDLWKVNATFELRKESGTPVLSDLTSSVHASALQFAHATPAAGGIDGGTPTGSLKQQRDYWKDKHDTLYSKVADTARYFVRLTPLVGEEDRTTEKETPEPSRTRRKHDR